MGYITLKKKDPVKMITHALFETTIKAFSIAGCMKDVRLNGKLLDFMNARKQQRVTPGCSEMDESSKPCKDHQCQKGKCVPLDKASYECQCRKGWSGEHCDKGKDLSRSMEWGFCCIISRSQWFS